MSRQEQKEARRQEILICAVDLFVKKGYHGTKISDIAERAQMSTGLLFHYFESKESLYLELARIGVEATRHPEKLEGLAPDEFFETFLRDLFEYASDKPWVFQMFVLMGRARQDGTPPEVRELAESIDQIRYSAAIIERGQREGVFRTGDPVALSTCFWASLQGVMEQTAMSGGSFSPDPAWLMSILRG